MYTSMYTTLKELSEHPDTQLPFRDFYRSLEGSGVSGGGGVELTWGALWGGLSKVVRKEGRKGLHPLSL